MSRPNLRPSTSTEPRPGAWAGCEHGPSDREPTPAGALSGTTLEFVAQGVGTLVLAGQSYALAPGMIFTHGPGVSFRITTDEPKTLVRYYVCLDGAPASALLERYGPPLGAVVYTAAPLDVRGLFDELIRASRRETALAPRIAAVSLEHLILRIAETTVEDRPALGTAFATYLRCREHIDQRWGDLATLEQLASECEVDPAYVCRLFRRFDEQTPYQRLLRRKIQHAATRLVEGGASVKEVADDLGFSDPFHFSRVFRRVMGVPPGRYAATHGRGPSGLGRPAEHAPSDS